jgi:hypothetical protein
MTVMINDLPPMDRAALLRRCKSEGERLQELSIAVNGIAGALRSDVTRKAESDDYQGLTVGQQEGLLVALELIADKLYQDGDSLEMMAFRQLPAA